MKKIFLSNILFVYVFFIQQIYIFFLYMLYIHWFHYIVIINNYSFFIFITFLSLAKHTKNYIDSYKDINFCIIIKIVLNWVFKKQQQFVPFPIFSRWQVLGLCFRGVVWWGWGYGGHGVEGLHYDIFTWEYFYRAFHGFQAKFLDVVWFQARANFQYCPCCFKKRCSV